MSTISDLPDISVPSNSDDMSDIKEACSEFIRQIGFNYYLYGGFQPLINKIIVLDNMPAEWTEAYYKNGSNEFDPRTGYCLKNTAPIRWDDLKFRPGTDGAQEKRVMDDIRELGIVDGISIPIHGAGTECALLNLSATNRLDDLNQQKIERIVLFSQSLQTAVRTVTKRNSQTTQDLPELTTRERECLQWIAAGKTAWEAAKILGLAESTIAFHMNNVIQKLGVPNRPAAVAKAIALSQIKPY